MNMNRNILINIGVLFTGTALGVLSTQQYFKVKYKKIADEDVRSVKDMYKKITGIDTDIVRYCENDVKAIQALHDDFEQMIGEASGRARSEPLDAGRITAATISLDERLCKQLIRDAGYDKKSENIEERKEEKDVSEPYVISPDEYDDLVDEYVAVSLTYYADGILADDVDNIVDNIDETIGQESLEHFGEYEEDTVYVRNDEKKIVYEVCLDPVRYADLFPAHV